MRLGAFHRLLVSWAEAPCLLTIEVPFSGAVLTTRGTLRAQLGAFSLRGWVLDTDAGSANGRATQLHLEQMRRRTIDRGGAGPVLRFWNDGAAIRFSLRRFEEATREAGSPAKR